MFSGLMAGHPIDGWMTSGANGLYIYVGGRRRRMESGVAGAPGRPGAGAWPGVRK